MHTVPDEPARSRAAGPGHGLPRHRQRRRVRGAVARPAPPGATVRGIHERVYFRPLLEAFASTDGALSPEAAVARLVAFGFTDARRTQAAVRELTRGLNRASRLMQQMLPLMLDWLSTSPDPDLGLLQLRNLLAGKQRHAALVEAFRESPQAAQSAVRGARHQPAAGRHPGPQPRSGQPAPRSRAPGHPATRRAGGQRRQRRSLAEHLDRAPGRAAPLERSQPLRRGRPRSVRLRRRVGRRTGPDHVGRGGGGGGAGRPRSPGAVRGDRHGPLRRSRAELRQRPRRDLRLRRLGCGRRGRGRPGGHRPVAVRGRPHPGRAPLRDGRRPATRRSSGLHGPQPRSVPAPTGSTTPWCGNDRP